MLETPTSDRARLAASHQSVDDPTRRHGAALPDCPPCSSTDRTHHLFVANNFRTGRNPIATLPVRLCGSPRECEHRSPNKAHEDDLPNSIHHRLDTQDGSAQSRCGLMNPFAPTRSHRSRVRHAPRHWLGPPKAGPLVTARDLAPVGSSRRRAIPSPGPPDSSGSAGQYFGDHRIGVGLVRGSESSQFIETELLRMAEWCPALHHLFGWHGLSIPDRHRKKPQQR